MSGRSRVHAPTLLAVGVLIVAACVAAYGYVVFVVSVLS